MKFLRTHSSFLVIAMAIASQNLSSAQSTEMVAEIEGITEYRLNNGCRVLLFPDQSKPEITVNMTIFVGSRHEGYGETGMAHLLEHLMFKGTPTNRDIPKSMKDRGATNFNGTTWYDRTNYYETLPASDENLEFAIGLEADRLVNSFISGTDLASEMTVVRNEFERGENSPRRVLSQRIMSNAFEWHNYGKSTIGNRADIERVPINRLKNFYSKFYRTDNIMLVVAGRFDVTKALTVIEKHFGALEAPQTAIEPTYTEEPVQDGERVVYLRRVGDVSMVGAGYHIPSASHPDSVAVEVLAQVLSMRPSGRLYKKLVETKLASSATASADSGHDPGMLLCFAEVPPEGDVDKTKDALLATVEEVGQSEISDEEVQRGVAELLKRRDDLMANTSRLAIELSEWAAYGDWRLFFVHRDQLEKVSTSEVKRVAQDYLMSSNRTVGLFIPTKDPVRARIPESPSVEKMVADYKGRAKVAEGEVFDTAPDSVEQRVTRGQLKSGLRFAFLPKKTKAEKVLLTLNLRFGDEKGLNQGRLNDACDVVAELMVRGTKQLSYQQIQDKLRDLKANLSSQSGTGEASFRMECRREDLVAALDVFRQILREPTFPAEEFELIRTQQLTRAEAQKSEPQSLAVEALMRKLMPYEPTDIRYYPTISEQIERLKALQIDDIQKLYTQFFNGQNGELVVVGDFDSAEIQPILEQIFVDWKSPNPYQRIDMSARAKIASESVVIETPDKTNAVFFAGITLPMRDDHPEFEAMFVGNNILGGGALSNRLAVRVRQKEGLSYSVGSQFSAEPLDERATFMTFAIMNPTNRDRVQEAVSEEFARILESGVTGDELDKSKTGLIEQMRLSRGQDSSLAAILQKQLLTGRSMEFVKAREARIQGLTKEMVDKAIKTLVDRKQMITVTAGDFNGKPQADKNAEPSGDSDSK